MFASSNYYPDEIRDHLDLVREIHTTTSPLCGKEDVVVMWKILPQTPHKLDPDPAKDFYWHG
jgi:hypothetical protein